MKHPSLTRFQPAAIGALGILLLAQEPTLAQSPPPPPQPTPEIYGQWAGPWDWTDLIAPGHCNDLDEFAHGILLPKGTHKGKALLFRYNSSEGCAPSANTTHSWLFDPRSPSLLIKIQMPAGQSLASEIFCSGTSIDKNGDLVVAGGITSSALPDRVPRETYRFDPMASGLDTVLYDQAYSPPRPYVVSNPWTQLGDMSIRRYYPSMITLDRRSMVSQTAPSEYPVLPGGSQVVLGGAFAVTPEGHDTWQLLEAGASTWMQTLIPTGTLSQQLDEASAITETYSLEPASSVPDQPEQLIESYPRVFQLDNGEIFVAGDVDTAFQQPANTPGSTWVMRPPISTSFQTGHWELHAGTPAGSAPGPVNDRWYGSAVILHTLALNNRVLVFGGGERDPVTGLWTIHSSVQEYVIGENSQQQPSATKLSLSQWRPKAPLHVGRIYCNAVVLPTGMILILGGDRVVTGPIDPVFEPELYDPGLSSLDSGSSVLMASGNPVTLPSGEASPTPRLYHSFGLLLSDGRVLVAGGDLRDSTVHPDSEYSGELYYPPYMMYANRPHITSAPSSVGFGVPFTVTASIAAGHDVQRVVLIRPGAVTHHFDNDQRYIELPFGESYSPDGKQATLDVAAPLETWGPPGRYMLFVVVDNNESPPVRLPSVAEFIDVQ